MRKKSLRQTANKYFATDKRGNFKERKRRCYVIHKMIDDLFIIREIPANWQALNAEQIRKLILYWQKRKTKTATVMRHMGIIRKFLFDLECPVINEISNQSLGLRRKSMLRKKPKIYPGFWQNITIPSAKLLLGFQIHFGLTLHETMHLSPHVHIQEHSLWITREIATNSQDRFIPVRNEIQASLLKEYKATLQEGETLIQKFSYQRLLAEYKEVLNELKLLPNKSYRYLYARQLHHQFIHVLGNYELTWLIMEEMGLSSRTTVWTYLNNE